MNSGSDIFVDCYGSTNCNVKF